MFGWGYVNNFCISLFRKEQEEKAYNNYVTRCLRLIAENSAKLSGGSYIKMEYEDIIKPRKIETRTSEEIINDIRQKLEKLNS